MRTDWEGWRRRDPGGACQAGRCSERCLWVAGALWQLRGREKGERQGWPRLLHRAGLELGWGQPWPSALHSSLPADASVCTHSDTLHGGLGEPRGMSAERAAPRCLHSPAEARQGRVALVLSQGLGSSSQLADQPQLANLEGIWGGKC